ncbi:hypothetical protein [Kribbella qitaiheensis]|uniref:hypothetical protein n=1 Tax=Kribbella qitaiheensis TaxID=1544730 RepID=UPI001FEA17E9|nr:hypothetical protein [Kribbella qitaiheensis]
MTDDELVGRAGLVERAKKQLETSGSVLLYGPTGIGKSAAGRALVAERTRAGCRILSAAPSQSEAGPAVRHSPGSPVEPARARLAGAARPPAATAGGRAAQGQRS